MIDLLKLDRWRVMNIGTFEAGFEEDPSVAGWFVMKNRDIGVTREQAPSGVLRCIASSDGGWDHVSVSLINRVPNWYEMSAVAALFFPGEAAMQLHVPPSEHVNNHPHTLHLWRPLDGAIPKPPAVMVGLSGVGPGEARRMTMSEARGCDRAASGRSQ